MAHCLLRRWTRRIMSIWWRWRAPVQRTMLFTLILIITIIIIITPDRNASEPVSNIINSDVWDPILISIIIQVRHFFLSLSLSGPHSLVFRCERFEESRREDESSQTCSSSLVSKCSREVPSQRVEKWHGVSTFVLGSGRCFSVNGLVDARSSRHPFESNRTRRYDELIEHVFANRIDPFENVVDELQRIGNMWIDVVVLYSRRCCCCLVSMLYREAFGMSWPKLATVICLAIDLWYRAGEMSISSVSLSLRPARWRITEQQASTRQCWLMASFDNRSSLSSSSVNFPDNGLFLNY